MTMCNLIILYSITCQRSTNKTDSTFQTTQIIFIKKAYSLPIAIVQLFSHTKIFSFNKLNIGQLIIKSIQRHLLKITEIVDKRTGKRIDPPNTTFTNSRNSPCTCTIHGKIVFNNLENGVKIHMKSVCEIQATTNDLIKKGM